MKKKDIILNMILPMALGILFYLLPASEIVRNHMSDGLWAYSLTSTILIIWSRKASLLWLLFVVLLFPFFELLQYLNIINGTGDLLDVFTYIIFFLIALITNNSFKLKFNYL